MDILILAHSLGGGGLTVNLTQLSGKRISIESCLYQIDLGAMSVENCLLVN